MSNTFLSDAFRDLNALLTLLRRLERIEEDVSRKEKINRALEFIKSGKKALKDNHKKLARTRLLEASYLLTEALGNSSANTTLEFVVQAI